MTRRPAQTPPRLTTPRALRALAQQATYVGSKEHKTVRWWGGNPGVRVDRRTGKAVGRPHKQKTTICPLTGAPAEQRRATAWVKAAIRSGRCRFVESDDRFPKHVWYRVRGQAWFGFCINSTAGQYKGWPLEGDEPDALFD